MCGAMGMSRIFLARGMLSLVQTSRQAGSFQTQRKVPYLLPLLIILPRLSSCSCFICTPINHIHPSHIPQLWDLPLPGTCLQLSAGLVQAGCLLCMEFAQAAAQSCGLVPLLLPSHTCEILTRPWFATWCRDR